MASRTNTFAISDGTLLTGFISVCVVAAVLLGLVVGVVAGLAAPSIVGGRDDSFAKSDPTEKDFKEAVQRAADNRFAASDSGMKPVVKEAKVIEVREAGEGGLAGEHDDHRSLRAHRF